MSAGARGAAVKFHALAEPFPLLEGAPFEELADIESSDRTRTA